MTPDSRYADALRQCTGSVEVSVTDNGVTSISTAAEARVSDRYIPTGAQKIDHALGCCYVHDKESHGRIQYCVIAYRGTAEKKSFYESYRRAEDRDKRVADFFAGLESSAAYKAERRAARSKPHDLKVGDVVYNSWGWEQTNVSFYQIVKATANYVWLQPVRCESVPSEGDGPMSGRVRPVTPIEQILTRETRDYGDFDHNLGFRPSIPKTETIQPEMRRAEGKSVRFDHGSGCLWDGKSSQYHSWYA